MPRVSISIIRDETHQRGHLGHPVIAMGGVGILLDALSLGWLGALGDGLGHECHELADGATLVERKLGEIGGADEDSGGWWVAGCDGEDGKLVDSHASWRSLRLVGRWRGAGGGVVVVVVVKVLTDETWPGA
jgi:hypothetical protein